MVDLATMKGRTVSSGKNVLDAAFSEPDDFLYYIEADSGSDTGAIYKTRTFMYGAVTVLEQDGHPRRDLAVSSDGATLLFCSNRGGLWHVYAVDSSAASPPIKLTVEKANHRHPRVSPDGKLIAYLSDLGGFDGRMELWVFERKTWKHRRITVSSNVRDFCWKDDSKTIYFSSGVNVCDINSIDVLERQAGFKKMTPSGAQKNWSETAPRFIRYKGAPKIVYTREYIDGKRELYWFDTRYERDDKIFTFGEWNEWTE
jgi:Tol biopolymer transport system component